MDLVRLEDHPEIEASFEAWLEGWDLWAEAELEDTPVRELYAELFSTYVKATGHPEELELVLGIGCLAWQPAGHVAVRRHMLTCPAGIHFDDDTGSSPSPASSALDPLTVELDMLDPGLITNPQHINDIKAGAKEFEGHPLHHDDVGALARRLVHTLDPDGAYLDDVTVPGYATGATAAYAPALILRSGPSRGWSRSSAPSWRSSPRRTKFPPGCCRSSTPTGGRTPSTTPPPAQSSASTTRSSCRCRSTNGSCASSRRWTHVPDRGAGPTRHRQDPHGRSAAVAPARAGQAGPGRRAHRPGAQGGPRQAARGHQATERRRRRQLPSATCRTSRSRWNASRPPPPSTTPPSPRRKSTVR